MCRELAALNIAVGGTEHAQRILLSGVKASLYDNTRASLCAANSRLLMRWVGLNMRTFLCTSKLYVGGAEHAQTFNV